MLNCIAFKTDLDNFIIKLLDAILVFTHLLLTFFCTFFCGVEHVVLCDDTCVASNLLLEVLTLWIDQVEAQLELLKRVSPVVDLVVGLALAVDVVLLELRQLVSDLLKLALKNLDLLHFVFIVVGLVFDVFLEVSENFFPLLQLSVILVLESDEMLVKWNSVSEEHLIAIGSVPLLDLSFFEQLQLLLHQDDLLFQLENILLLKLLGLSVLEFLALLGAESLLLELRVALKLLVSV